MAAWVIMPSGTETVAGPAEVLPVSTLTVELSSICDGEVIGVKLAVEKPVSRRETILYLLMC